MTDNLASQHPAAPPPQPPVVPQPTGDFMSSFLGAVSVSAADCFHSSNQHPQQPPISECSSHEPLINVSINSGKRQEFISLIITIIGVFIKEILVF